MRKTAPGINLASSVLRLLGGDARCRSAAKEAGTGCGSQGPLVLATLEGRPGSPRQLAPLGARDRGAGHEVRLIPSACVRAYVKRQKKDAADAGASPAGP